jgi:uncharacterized membrane protein
MWQRMTIALTALVSGAVALYLHLWKLGLMGALACGGGQGCNVVQGSRYSWVAVPAPGGEVLVDVALIGAVGYSAILLVALLGINERWGDARWPTLALMGLIFPAFLFTLWLKYAEFVLLRSFCPWCAVSTVTITLHVILVTLDWRRVRLLEREGEAAVG